MSLTPDRAALPRAAREQTDTTMLKSWMSMQKATPPLLPPSPVDMPTSDPDEVEQLIVSDVVALHHETDHRLE
jgi:hypothetical protein